MQIAALLATHGVDPGYYLRARWPDDVGILEALAIEADSLDRDRAKRWAREIANAVGEMLDKSL